LFVQSFLQSFNASIGAAFFGIGGETGIFLLMAWLAGERTNINRKGRGGLFCSRAWRYTHHEEQRYDK
jgi:hypothetical protein